MVGQDSHQFTNRSVSVTPEVTAQTVSPRTKLVRGVVQSEAKVAIVSTWDDTGNNDEAQAPTLALGDVRELARRLAFSVEFFNVPVRRRVNEPDFAE